MCEIWRQKSPSGNTAIHKGVILRNTCLPVSGGFACTFDLELTIATARRCEGIQ